jgi:hypothetical protein
MARRTVLVVQDGPLEMRRRSPPRSPPLPHRSSARKPPFPEPFIKGVFERPGELLVLPDLDEILTPRRRGG